MRSFVMALAATSLAVPASMALPTTSAEAAPQRHHEHYRYKEWRGRDGRLHCRKPDGTTGLVIGGVAGALVGRTIDTHGDRTAGTLLGAAAGAVAGRAIERSSKRCK
ncbi:glycine zipper 2TM domain-containing protein [Stakelama marina]|uniref:17 kDa surface antigen n=1 Tax=Stakelama marina TaxID=2826939 RepID=A0A8T4IIR6_9SPHN|nr:glycine zipper 2TM domain-containing protein [Stakelama marina]MBR0553774.1 glycine zipper 2TM domain-containing protein [Stakelama marina]